MASGGEYALTLPNGDGQLIRKEDLPKLKLVTFVATDNSAAGAFLAEVDSVESFSVGQLKRDVEYPAMGYSYSGGNPTDLIVSFHVGPANICYAKTVKLTSAKISSAMFVLGSLTVSSTIYS